MESHSLLDMVRRIKRNLAMHSSCSLCLQRHKLFTYWLQSNLISVAQRSQDAQEIKELAIMHD